MEMFNVKFVGEIKKYPQLYNSTLKEYSKRDVTEKAWTKIATAMDMSVGECKEKWRNLRSAFARNLKPIPGRTEKKPYYLMEAMQFAIPFIRVAGNPSGYLPSSHQTPEEGDVDADADQEEESLDPLSSAEDLPSPEIAEQATPAPSTGKKGPNGYPTRDRKFRRAQEDAEEAFPGYFAPKKAKLVTKKGSRREEGIRHYLLSLMPDLVQMNDSQLRKFKIRALELVEEIVPPQSYSDSAAYPYR